MKTPLVLTAALVASLSLFSPSYAAEIDDETLTERIRDILKGDLSIIEEAIEIYVARKKAEALNERKIQGDPKQAALRLFPMAIQGAKNDLGIEPDENTLILVEFFDYRCPHCRSAVSKIKEFLRKDGNTQLALLEFPILGPESTTLAQISLAAWLQTARAIEAGTESSADYFGLHDALMDVSSETPPSEDRALELAAQFGFDPETLNKDRTGPEIEEIISQSYSIATEVGFNGTPAFLLYSLDGTQVEGFPGVSDPENLARAAENIRNLGKDDG